MCICFRAVRAWDCGMGLDDLFCSILWNPSLFSLAVLPLCSLSLSLTICPSIREDSWPNQAQYASLTVVPTSHNFKNDKFEAPWNYQCQPAGSHHSGLKRDLIFSFFSSASFLHPLTFLNYFTFSFRHSASSICWFSLFFCFFLGVCL